MPSLHAWKVIAVVSLFFLIVSFLSKEEAPAEAVPLSFKLRINYRYLVLLRLPIGCSIHPICVLQLQV